MIVDDDPSILRCQRAIIELAGYEVLVAQDGETALRMVIEDSPALMLLDLGLPDMDGFEVCRRVRKFSSIPIIVVSVRDTEWDKVRAFHLGADDYVTKPCGYRELLARINAVLRRTRSQEPAQPEPLFSSGDLKIDFGRRRVEVRGNPVNLSLTEYRLLCELVQHRDKVLLPAELLTRVWGAEYRDDTSLLRTCIWRLRKRIEPDPHHPKYIVRVAGGYMFNHSW